MGTITQVRVIECINSAELHRHYGGQSEAQPAYIELGLRDGVLFASYDAEIGGAKPFSVRHGFNRRYDIPVLTGEAANRFMGEIVPLAERILADWEEIWDGNNMVARLGMDALAADEEIQTRLGLPTDGNDYRTEPNQGFGDSDLVIEWDIGAAVNGCEVDEYDITADTMDERLDEIGRQILSDLADCGPAGATVCHGLEEHLRGLRDELSQAVADAHEG